MYKIMVVEDSKPIMRNIINQIEMIDSRLKVIAIAYDGEEALKKLKKVDIDILFTDIKMPKMNGLMMIQEAKKICPSLKCIIISGYDDFEYAKQAIKLQIAEYLLKPLDALALKTILDKVIKDIIAEKEMILYNLLNDLDVCEIHPNKLEINNLLIIIVRTSIFENGLQILSRIMLHNYIDEIYTNELYVINTKIASEKVIVIDISRNEIVKTRFLVDSLFNRLKIDFVQINMAVSDEINNISDLNARYRKLSNTLNNLVIIDKPQIIYENSNHYNAEIGNMHEEFERLKVNIYFLIKNRQAEIFNKELSRCFTEWQEKNYPAVFIKKSLLMILDNFIQAFKEIDKIIQFDFSSKIDNLLSNATTYIELRPQSMQIFNQFFEWLSENQKNMPVELFKHIDSFLKHNIYNNISMQELSGKFNVSSSYITRVIKKYSNMSPIEYYMKLKIDEAKKLIDCNEHVMFKDIADSLGFNDQHYFSKVFKSFVGCSPTDYKKMP